MRWVSCGYEMSLRIEAGVIYLPVADSSYTRLHDPMDLWPHSHEMGRLIIDGASEKFDTGSSLGPPAGPLPAGAKWKKNTGHKVLSPKDQFGDANVRSFVPRY